MLALLPLLGACSQPENALARGDRLWADSSFTEALAEYRLALRQRDDPSTLLRVAHGYAQTGQVERAREAYGRVTQQRPESADQAVFDFLRLARSAAAAGDQHALARAWEAAADLRPGLRVPTDPRVLARYYSQHGYPERALEFFERALAQAPPDSATLLLFEIGMLHEGLGNCAAALPYFQAFVARTPPGREAPPSGERNAPPSRAEARWHTGNCAFLLARSAQQEGRITEALEHLATVNETGVPENVQEQAWFLRGELLFALGRFPEALAAYERTIAQAPYGGPLAERAERRIFQIRFGL